MKWEKKLYDVLAAGITLYIFMLAFWEFMPIIPFLGIRISGLLKILLVSGAAFAILTKKKKFAFNIKQNILMAGLLALIAVSLIGAIYFDFALFRFDNFFNIVLLYFLIIHLIDKEKYLKWVLAAIVLSAVLHSFFIFFSCYTGIGVITGSYLSFVRPELIGDSNAISIFLVSSIPLCFYFLKYEKKRIKEALLSLAMIFIFLAILTTFSRTWVISLCVALVLILIEQRPRKLSSLRKNHYFVLALLMLILIPIFLLSNVFNEGNAISGHCKRTDLFGYYQERLQIWSSGLSMALDNLLAGVGANNFAENINKYNVEYGDRGYNVKNRSAHNTYLSIMVELGIFGLLFFLGIIYLTIVSLYKSKNIFSNPILISFIAIVAAGFFLTLEGHYLPWLFVSLAAALERIK